MITRNKELLLPDGLPPADMLRSVIREHARELPRLCKLREYYAGRHDILRRERRAGLPNSRVPHGFAAYISDMAAGYLIGAPVRYESTEALTALQNALLLCDAPSVDAELAMQQSVYGKGVELTWVDRDGLPRCTALDPKEAFVVYSDDVSAEPLFGVRLYWEKDARGCRAARRA